MAGFLDMIMNLVGQKQEQPKPESNAPMSEMADRAKEIEEVAKVIAAESASLGRRGMMATAHVINNRGGGKKSPYEIVTKKNQFYGYTNKNKDKIYKDVREEALEIATMLYNNELGEDFTQGAKYFRQPTEKVQAWHGDETITIGNHIFHKERQ